jgi:hypothetical protein
MRLGSDRPYIASGQYQGTAYQGAFVWAEDSVATPRDTLRGVWNSNQGLHRDSWHTLPDGISYLGRYQPAQWVMTDPDDEDEENEYRCEIFPEHAPVPCAHCAVVTARALAGDRGTIVFVGDRPIARNLFPACGEVIGSAATPLCTAHPAPDGTRCTNCWGRGHNRRTCTHGAHLRQIGVEIEGRWRRADWAAVRTLASGRGIPGCSDGSINTLNGYTPYEWQTKPDTLAGAIDQLLLLYPHHAGRDCSMHVHTSFQDCFSLTRLCTQEFVDFFEARWRAWGAEHKISPNSEFFERLDGENSYCARMSSGNLPRGEMSNMDRYAQLNFSAFQKHGTLECRLLPMFRDSRLAVSALEELMSIYQDFLDQPFELAGDPAHAQLALDSGVLVAHEISVPDFEPVRESPVLDIIELPPPAPGMVRTAIFGRETIETLNRIVRA